MKVLVIGSKGYGRAQCVDWMQPFPNIEEHDALIIDLRALDQSSLDRLFQVQPLKMDDMIDPIITLLSTGRKVYCIMQLHITKTPPRGAGRAYVSPPDSNYRWLPLPIALQIKKGDSISDIPDRQFEQYLKLVDKWSIEVLGFFNGANVIERGSFNLDWFRGISPQSAESTVVASITPIAINKSGKSIGAFITTNRGTGTISLLPPTTVGPADEAVEVLLDIILDKKPDVRPRWWSGVDVPGLSQATSQLRVAKEQSNKAAKDLEALEKEVAAIEDYRDLVSATGDDLESVVKRVLERIGITTERTPPGYPADLLTRGKVAVEVTGISDKVDSRSEKMFQLQRFEEKEQKGERVILVANTYRRLEPAERKGKMNFTEEVKDHFKRHKVCALTSVDLLELWRRVEGDPTKKSDVQRLLMSTDGELTL